MTEDFQALEAAVLRVLDDWSTALREKDPDALRACYADDVRVFDDQISLPVDCGAQKPTYILDGPDQCSGGPGS